jgi:hypothetical protein
MENYSKFQRRIFENQDDNKIRWMSVTATNMSESV